MNKEQFLALGSHQRAQFYFDDCLYTVYSINNKPAALHFGVKELAGTIVMHETGFTVYRRFGSIKLESELILYSDLKPFNVN